jgi:hypothetical protein
MQVLTHLTGRQQPASPDRSPYLSIGIFIPSSFIGEGIQTGSFAVVSY